MKNDTQFQIHSHSNISRRDIVKSAIAVTAAVASGAVLAEDEHKGHDHHTANPNLGLVNTALDCIKTSQACMEHCVQLMKEGDTSLVQCVDLVQETLAMCDALSQMASYQSKHLGAVAKVCISVCKDCEEECRKHENKHVECKECADSCVACIKECEKIAA